METERETLSICATFWPPTWLGRGCARRSSAGLIIETFFHSPAHITSKGLLGQVRRADPRVGYATVYRTLKLLAESGVANERHFGDGVTRYELADGDTHHDHLICIECQGITEFEEPRIETLQDEVASTHGFELRTHKHELYGVCARVPSQRRSGQARNEA